MKKILSAVLALCMIFGCMAVGFTAQAATPADLQNGINQAIAKGEAVYTWTGGDITLSSTLTINGNIKVDFGGAKVRGPIHRSTVVINGGNVELFNVYFKGMGQQTSGLPAFVGEIADAKPTVLVCGGNVTLNSAFVLGAVLRIPGTQETLPLSDAITIASGSSVVNLNNVRAFGNIGVENLNGSVVNVEECLVGGYMADFENDANVNFAADTIQYRTMDFLKEALADEVTLTPNEDKYISALFDEYLEVTASIKEQNYVEPTYDYDAETDTLKVTATADKPVERVRNAFDYYYIPKTATILGETEDFVLVGSDYVATFENIEAETVCDTALEYALAVDLGQNAQALVDKAVNALSALVEDIPAILGKAFDELDDAVDTYINGEQGYATLLWNFYNDPTVGVGSIINAIEDPTEKAKAQADVKKFLGPIFDLCGASLYGDAQLDAALAALAAGKSLSMQQTAKITKSMKVINGTYGSKITADNGGIGLLDTFLAYANDIKALAIKEQGGSYVMNDVKGLGEYIGANYLEMYDFVKKVGDLVRDVVALVNDSDNYVMKMLNESGFTVEGKTLSYFAADLNGYVEMMDDAFAMVDGFLATNKNYQSILATYSEYGIDKMAGIYLEKAYNILCNPLTYIDITTDGKNIEGFSFDQVATYTTPEDEILGTKVTVNVIGYGKYSVDGKVYTAQKAFAVEQGKSFTFNPVEFDAGNPLYLYTTIADTNGNERMCTTGTTINVYSNTIINIYFAPVGVTSPEIIFMTNYDLSTQYLGTLSKEDIEGGEEIPAAPNFEGADFLGWYDLNISGEIGKEIGCYDESTVYGIIGNTDSNITLYAIYDIPVIEIDPALLAEPMTYMDSFVDNTTAHKAYFSFLFSEDSNVNIVEAGVLASASEQTTTDATPDGGAGIIKGTVTSDVQYPVIYTYSVGSGAHANLTVYAKGFVTVQNEDGSFTTTYSAVYSQSLTAY